MFEFLLGLAAGMVCAFLFLLVVLFRFGAHAPPPFGPDAADGGAEGGRRTGAAHRRMRTEASLLASQSRQDGLPFDIPAYLAGYDESKDVETCAWLDIILHRVFRAFLHEAHHVKFEDLFNRRLAGLKIPEFVRPITLTDVNFGSVTPVVQDVKVLSWRDQRPVIMEMRVSYEGDAHASVRTEVILNLRQKSLASLPIEVAISDIEFDAVVQVYLYTSLQRPVVSFSFVQQPHVSFKVHSEIGASLTLKDLPHLKNILLNAIIRNCRVLPDAYTVELGGVSLDRFGEGPAPELKSMAAKKVD